MAPSSAQIARHPTYSLPASVTERQDRASITQGARQTITITNCCQIGQKCELYITFTFICIQIISVLSTKSTIRSTSPSTSGSTARSTCGSTGDSTRYSDSTIKSTTQQGYSPKVSYMYLTFIQTPVTKLKQLLSQKYRYTFRQSCDKKQTQATLYMKLWHWETDTSNFHMTNTDLQMIQIFSWTCNQFYMQIYIWIYTQIYQKICRTIYMQIY